MRGQPGIRPRRRSATEPQRRSGTVRTGFPVPPWGGKDQYGKVKRGYCEQGCVQNEKQFATSAEAGTDGRSHRWSRRWDQRYKQTQFGDADRDRHRPATAPAEPSPGPIAQTNPIGPTPPGKSTAAKATSPAVTGDERAKRSQFLMGGHPWARAGEAAPATIAGPERAKQTQFRQSETKGKRLMEKEL